MRVSTGVPGLDDLTGGGFIPGTVNIVAGTPGTGKTILGIQYLVEGARRGERGIYISLEERAEDVAKFVSSFGWDIIGLAEKDFLRIKQFKISPPKEERIEGVTATLRRYKLPQAAGVLDLYTTLKDDVVTGKYSRVVIDSASVLKYSADGERESRVHLASLFRFLKEHGLTTIVIMEKKTADDPFEFEEFLADTVIRLADYPTREERKRGLVVVKMRGSSVDRTTRPYRIGENGIEVYSGEYLL